MSDLEPKNLPSDLPSSNNPTGLDGIQRFTSKQFGATFSRVTRIVHETVTGEVNPDTGNVALRMPCPRPKDVILTGRICLWPNKTRTMWQSLQEKTINTPPVDTVVLTFASNPFYGFTYQGFFLDFDNFQIAAGTKYVVQLLFIEL